jgi:hypothetical protein
LAPPARRDVGALAPTATDSFSAAADRYARLMLRQVRTDPGDLPVDLPEVHRLADRADRPARPVTEHAVRRRRRVKDAARARLAQGPNGRSSRPAALRDLPIILMLGGMGLRSEEVRMVHTSSTGPKRSDGLTPWLTVHGKGDKTRELPIPTEGRRRGP